MSTGNVTVVMKAADAELLRAWDRARQGPRQMQEELDKISNKSRQAKTESSTMFATMAGGFTAAAIASSGFSRAMSLAHQSVALIRREYDELIQRQHAAAGFQGSVAAAQRGALRSLGTDLTGEEMVQGANRIQGGTGADLDTIYNTINSSLSGRGQLSSAEAIKQVEATVKLDPSMAGPDLAALSGAGLDIRKFFGGTPEQAIGILLAGQQTARVTETGEYARNVVPGLTALGMMGTGVREASALISAITQESSDVSGRRSRTAAIQFGKQVTEATNGVEALQGKGVIERLDYLLSGESNAEQIRRGLVGGFDQDLLKFGYTDKGELTGEAAQYMAMIQLLTPGSHTKKLYDVALSQTPELNEAEQVYQRNLDLQDGLVIQRSKKAEEIFRGALQRRLGDGEEGLLGAVDEGLNRYLSQLGSFGAPGNMPGFIGRFGERMALQNIAAGNPELGLTKGEDPRRVAAAILQGRIDRGRASGAAGQPGGAEVVEEIQGVQRELLDAALRDAKREGNLPEAAAIKKQLEPNQPKPPIYDRFDPLRLFRPTRDETSEQKDSANSRQLDEQTAILKQIARLLADNRVRIQNPAEPGRAAARGRPRPAPVGKA